MTSHRLPSGIAAGFFNDKKTRKTKPRRGQQRWRRLRLEQLEDRRLLATIYSNSLDTNPAWSTTGGGQWAFGDPTGAGGSRSTVCRHRALLPESVIGPLRSRVDN